MKELFYYSIFAVILYFVLTAIFDNFTLEQENFDPSLVPVSSIITLAKVAQKLVNGNGTLTNPGNLQIGSSTSAPGNLTVTGNANINGTLTLGGTDIGKYVIDKINTLSTSLTTNALTVKGNANVTGDLTVKGTNILDTINDKVNTLANYFITKTLEVTTNLNVTGTTTLYSNAGDGFLKLGTDRWIKGVDGSFRTYYGNNSRSYYGSGDGTHEWRVASDGGTAGMTLDTGGNLVVAGTINAAGNINARTNGYNTRIGGIWTAPGIYAEGSANLEIGAGSNNIYIGAANGGVKQNLIVTGKLTVGDVDAVATITALTDRIVELTASIDALKAVYALVPIVGVYRVPLMGTRATLSYGWNIMWYDPNGNPWKNFLQNYGWNGDKSEKYITWAGVDTRNGWDNTDTMVPFFTLLPGYKLQLFGYNTGSDQMGPVGPEYKNSDPVNKSSLNGWRIHIVAVRKIDETWILPRLITK